MLRVTTTLAAMPAPRNAFVHGWISWSQVRAIVTATRRVDAGTIHSDDDPAHFTLVVEAIDHHAATLPDPDAGLSATGSFVVVEDAPEPPPLRMSATVGMLAGADAIALVGHGDAKAEAAAAVVTEGPLSQRPARVVRAPGAAWSSRIASPKS